MVNWCVKTTTAGDGAGAGVNGSESWEAQNLLKEVVGGSLRWIVGHDSTLQIKLKDTIPIYMKEREFFFQLSELLFEFYLVLVFFFFFFK